MTRRLHLLLVAVPLLVAGAVTPLVVDPADVDGTVEAHGAAAQPDDEELLATGRELYERSCSSCHGEEGEGVDEPGQTVRGPSLQEAGEAAAYYYLSTGRMPLSNSDDQPVRKPPAFDDDEIEALVAYVGSLGDGPAIPDVDLEGADVAAGGVTDRANCQPCHSASGSGGALSYGRSAPRLADATPTEVAAAVRVGPGQMPVFGPEVIDGDELDDLVAYVEYLRDPEDPGGLPIGRTGPIPEGFVAWLVGMVALLVIVYWIGTRSPIRRSRA